MRITHWREMLFSSLFLRLPSSEAKILVLSSLSLPPSSLQCRAGGVMHVLGKCREGFEDRPLVALRLWRGLCQSSAAKKGVGRNLPSSGFKISKSTRVTELLLST